MAIRILILLLIANTGKHRHYIDFQTYSIVMCCHMLERNILICNRTIFISNTCKDHSTETINHTPDFMRMTKQYLNDAASRIYNLFKMSRTGCVWLEELLEGFWKINL